MTPHTTSLKFSKQLKELGRIEEFSTQTKKEMNKKVLLKKLEKKTQEIIEGAQCDICGKPIIYILLAIQRDGAGMSSERKYSKFKSKRIMITNQQGERREGYLEHECATKPKQPK